MNVPGHLTQFSTQFTYTNASGALVWMQTQSPITFVRIFKMSMIFVYFNEELLVGLLCKAATNKEVAVLSYMRLHKPCWVTVCPKFGKLLCMSELSLDDVASMSAIG